MFYQHLDGAALRRGLSAAGLALGLVTAAYLRCPQGGIAFAAEVAEATVSDFALTAEDLGLADGTYQVEVVLEGGSGKASVESPTTIVVADGQITATVIFSSPYYDYMIVGQERYQPVNTEGNSTFQIPIEGFDYSVEIIADTTAMSTPHEIEYTLFFDSTTILSGDDSGDGTAEGVPEGNDSTGEEDTSGEQNADDGAGDDAEISDGGRVTDESSTDYEDGASDGENASDQSSEAAGEEIQRAYPSGEDWCGLTWERSLELLYAEQFTVDYYEGGYARIVIADADVFLVVPEDVSVPEGLDDDVTVLQQPIQNIYLVATSAMDFFCKLDALDAIRLSGTKASGWYLEEAQEAMEAGEILYAGKYSAPDYELILAENCGLAIESTMIYHNPEVQEKLETFGIPVLVERSSYESHPMGRTEWIKLYAVLLGLEDEAEEFFNEQVARVQEVEASESLDKTVAFFYITSSGTANVRKSNDYVVKMIELAGGTYVFSDLGEDDSATSTINMTMEEFYAQAKDADVIIYNSTIDGEIYTIEELLGKSALLSDFKAVQNGNVWCTGKNLFQETTSLGDLIVEIRTILADEETDDSGLSYLHRVVE